MADEACEEREPIEVEVTLGDFKVKEKKFAASQRARRRWRLLKHVRMATRRTSLTQAESDLLKAISNKKVEKAVENAGAKGVRGDAAEGSSESNASSAARSRLRDSLERYKETLSSTEVKFLNDLLEAENVSDEAFVNTAKVLETDVIFSVPQKMDHERIEKLKGAQVLLRRTSARSPRTSTSSAMLASIPEIETEDILARDIEQRRELWKKRQSSMVKLNKKHDEVTKNGDSDTGNDEPVPEAPKESPLVSLFKKFTESSVSMDSSNSSGEEPKEEEQKNSRGEDVLSAKVEFSILGTSTTDSNATGLHVMTPPLMDTLRHYLPYAIQEDNFWLKYSLAEDGASIGVLLSKVRSSAHTILAIETVDGEVFGSFTSSPWRHMGQTYYGSCESFLWRLNSSRRGKCACKSLLERAKLESDIEIFKWAGANRNIQMVNKSILAVGGGEADKVIEKRLLQNESSVCVPEEDTASGGDQGANFGLALNSDLSSGSSGRCVTFETLSSLSKNGSTFEVSNAEVWTLTPMTDIPQAEKLELGRQFVFSNVVANMKAKPSLNCKAPSAA